MPQDIQIVSISGRLGKDIEKDQWGNSTISVAVTQRKKKTEEKADVVWYNLLLGNNFSENFLKWLCKGSYIFTTASIRSFYCSPQTGKISVNGDVKSLDFLPSSGNAVGSKEENSNQYPYTPRNPNCEKDDIVPF